MALRCRLHWDDGRRGSRDRPRHAVQFTRSRRRLRAGRRRTGGDVTEIGLCSTDELYFASGTLRRAGALFTASHSLGVPLTDAVWARIELLLPDRTPKRVAAGGTTVRDRRDRLHVPDGNAVGAPV
jgi:hypothetical protein